MANSGKYPVDTTTSVGRVRLALGDTDPSSISGTAPNQTGEYTWYSDEEIAALLEMKGSVNATSVYILRLVAISPAMKLKKWSSADLSVDGPAITEALLAAARDIERGDEAAAAAEVSAVFRVVQTGTVVGQPHCYEPYDTDEYDRSLPSFLI